MNRNQSMCCRYIMNNSIVTKMDRRSNGYARVCLLLPLPTSDPKRETERRNRKKRERERKKRKNGIPTLVVLIDGPTRLFVRTNYAVVSSQSR